MFRGPAGLPSLLKSGAQHFSGKDEVFFRNIEAVRNLTSFTQSALGPNGMNKLIVSHIEKQFVTSDSAVIAEQLEVVHPAAKILSLATQMHDKEFGDGTAWVVVFAGELLQQAAELLKQGLHISDILKGYEMAQIQAERWLKDQICFEIKNVRDVKEVTPIIKCVMNTKVQGHLDFLVGLTADAITAVMPSEPKEFNTDNIRVCKVSGGSLGQSQVINGMVMTREPKSASRKKEKCKVMVLNCDFDQANTESKGTILIENAEHLLSFSKTEEDLMEGLVKGIKDAGVEVVIIGGMVSDLALHYLDRYDIFVITSSSKFEIKRLCRTLGAVALPRLGVPIPDEIGTATYVAVEEISSHIYTVIRSLDTQISTIVLRGSTMVQLDEIERAIDDAVSCIKATTKDPRFVPGGAATEIALSCQLQAHGKTFAGLHQYPVGAYGQAFEVIGKILAENAGQNSMDTLSKLYAAHRDGKKTVGVNSIRGSTVSVWDMCPQSSATVVVKKGDTVVGEVTATSSPASQDVLPLTAGLFVEQTETTFVPIVDHYVTKLWGLKLATDAVLSILKVDQIIMSKPSGGPKFPDRGHWDNQDENY